MLSRTLLLVALLVVPLSVLSACEEKMGVEKRAEEIAKANAQAAASKSAEPPDPREQVYAQKVKSLRARTQAHLVALQKIYTGVPDPELQEFRSWFPATPEGSKQADEISKEAAFAGKEGMAIQTFEIQDLHLDEKMETGTVDVYQREAQRGKARCNIYKLVWKDAGGTWLRADKTSLRIIPCD